MTWQQQFQRGRIYEEINFESGVDDYYNENKMDTKPWYLSRTLWLAIVQAVVGALVALYTTNPDLATVGWGAVVKSLLDGYLRFSTVKTVV